MSEVELYGIDYLEKTFYEMQAADMRRVLVAAFKKAGQPMLDEMKYLVPVGNTRNLYNSLGMTVLPHPEIGVKIGARVKGSYKGFQGAVTNYGSGERVRYTRNRASTGRMPKSGWFTTAVEYSKDYCMGILYEEWYNSIVRYVKKNSNLITP